MANDITVLDALKMTMADLEKIPVKITDFDTIGIPLRSAVHNIALCVDALEKAEKEAVDAKEAADKEHTV